MPIEVACEVVYVLQKVYAVDREEVRQQLGHLLHENLVVMEKPPVFLKALEWFNCDKRVRIRLWCELSLWLASIAQKTIDQSLKPSPLSLGSTHESLFTTQISVLTTQISVLTTQISVLTTQISVLTTQISVLTTQISVLTT